MGFEKTTQSKVSIVVPVYNKIEYIDMMLESVYNQLWDNIELILVNDGATDGTRERLSEWEPKFSARGYEVTIIDQENQGIAGAVKSGLMQITGDYVCLADCDDTLDSKYVSTMAGWLDEHPDDQWTVCLYNKVIVEGNRHRVFATSIVEKTSAHPQMMEKYLSGKFSTFVWIYMVRISYLNDCKVIENYETEIRSVQEPGFVFPLIVGGGNLKVIAEPLYNHISYPTQTSAPQSAQHIVEFYNGIRNITIKTIDRLNTDAFRKKKWRAIAELTHKYYTMLFLKGFQDGYKYLSELAVDAERLIHKYFRPDPCISAEHILKNNYEYLADAIAYCILGHKPQEFSIVAGRVIGCGALGKSGKKRIPDLIGTPLEPTELWDVSASAGDSVCGIAVTVPEYGRLTSQDNVMILPTTIEIRAELYHEVEYRGLKNILLDADIRAYLSVFKYPQFYNECEFFVP